jgi:hypothetical protein
VCPYCGAEAVDSAKIYKKSFGLIYLRSNYPICDAYVGTHKSTGLPLGAKANEKLRDYFKNPQQIQSGEQDELQ